MSAKRIYGLDILRALAIFYVMLTHGQAYSGYLLDAGSYRWLTLDGVGLFFVLSGFVIHYNYGSSVSLPGGVVLRSSSMPPSIPSHSTPMSGAVS